MSRENFDWDLLQTQLYEVLDRLFLPMVQEQWPIEGGARHWDGWRYYPPLAFYVDWSGDDLNEERKSWLRDQHAYGRVQEIEIEYQRTGERKKKRVLIVFDLLPKSVPERLYHITPIENVQSILSMGLKPSCLTGISTTSFPESETRVHLFESEYHCVERWLLLEGNKERIPSGEYQILSVDPTGIVDLWCDVCTNHGYITERTISPQFVQVIQRSPIVKP